MSKFKVGDKVRYTAEEGPWFERQITVGDEGIVVGKGFYDDEVCVDFGVADDVCIEDLELVEPADPKREFLEKLGDLLREYDAKIQVYAGEDGDCGIGFYLGDLEENKNNIWYTNEWDGNRFNFPISTDNIMDFDKD